jgi:cytochrome P450
MVVAGFVRYGEMEAVGETEVVFPCRQRHDQLIRELADRWVSQIMDILTHHGNDLALAPYGEHWRQLQRFANRELLSARNLQTIREKHVEEVVTALVDEVGEISNARWPIHPAQMLPRSNSMIMFRSIFGRSEDDTGDFEERREDLLENIFWSFQNATATNLADYIPWLRFLPNNTLKEAKKVEAVQTGIVESLVDSVKARSNLDLENPTCLIEVMLAKEKEGELNIDVIRDLIGDLLAAGIDTSAQTVSWLLLILANRPDIQRKVHEELDRVVGPNNVPTLEDRERLPYLNAVVMENMRYRTVGPFGLPHKATKSCIIGGFAISEGAQVLGNIYGIHHDSRFWDSPDEFIPERFLPLPDGSPSPAMTGPAFIPFGVGHRACPGRRFADIVVWAHASRLLHRFQFDVLAPDGCRLPEDEVFGLTVSPKPFALQVIRR